MYERLLGHLSKKNTSKLIKILKKEGFTINPQGNVAVKSPKDNHPRFANIPLYVAYIGLNPDNSADYIELVNIHKKTLREYQKKIKEIFNRL